MKKMSLIIAIITAALSLSACGGGGGGGGGEGANPASGQASIPQNTELSPALATGPSSTAYDITLLGAFDGDSYAVALNDASQVIGNFTDRSGRINAFIWDAGVTRTIVTTGQASRINNLGQVVGWMEPNGHPEAYVYEGAGQVYRLNTIGGSSQALAINDSGLTAGRIINGGESAFLEDNGNLQVIAQELDGYAIAMNNVGQVLIKRLDANGFRTLLWQNGTLTDLGTLGGAETQGRDINDAGQIVGWSQTANGQRHAFLWENGAMVDLAPLAGEFSAAVAINDQGQILLKDSDLLESRNLLYENGEVTDLGNFGADYAVANDLNDRGEIVGWLATASGTSQAFLARPKTGGGL
jgi:probable HAF family extracellular repeat protein/YD repeat-containing protein